MTTRDLGGSAGRLLAADTWGVSGPSFLGWYVVLAVGLLATTWAVVRPRGARDIAERPISLRKMTPVQGALLGNSPRLAVVVALADLRSQGLITAEGRVDAMAKPASALEPLTAAVLASLTADPVTGRRPLRQLSDRPAVAAAVEQERVTLARSGLLLLPRHAPVLRYFAPLVVLLLVGAARVMAGIDNHKSVGFLVVLVAAVGGGTVFVAVRSAMQQLTASGRGVLSQARQDNDHLRPSMRPAWSTYGSGAVLMSTALFGGAAFAAADPAFADTFDARSVAPASGSFGMSSGSSGGGCSGGGCSGGSGCGGGGGCGGGCGG